MTIQAVDRAIDILSLFTVQRPHLGITEIADALGLTKGTAFGLVKTLAQRGLLLQDAQSRKYGLGLRLTELGVIQVWGMPVYQAGVYPVRRLSEKCGRSVRLYVWDGDAVLLILNMIHPSERFPFSGTMRPRFPAYCTGAGKAILSLLDEVELAAYLDNTELVGHTSTTITDRKALENELKQARTAGVAYDREEYVKGFNCASAPILDRSGRPCAAVSLSIGKKQFGAEALADIAEDVRQTATEISHSMGHHTMG